MKLKYFLRSLLFLLLAVIITLAVAFYETKTSSAFTLLRAICDGTFVSAVVLLAWGLFSFIINRGAFDSLAFAFTKIFSRFKKQDSSSDDYYNYLQEKKSRHKHDLSFLIPVSTGLLSLLVSIFTLLSL